MADNHIKPKFLNLFILGSRMGITAKISILHRLSGILLFLAIPYFLYLLHRSISDAQFYHLLYGALANNYWKIIEIILIWALCHHLCAGIRFLLIDINVGVNIKKSRGSALIVLLASITMTLIAAFLIW